MAPSNSKKNPSKAKEEKMAQKTKEKKKETESMARRDRGRNRWSSISTSLIDWFDGQIWSKRAEAEENEMERGQSRNAIGRRDDRSSARESPRTW